tara:strand:+ start:36 stop:221 length:186 start_codon:yes stop_codon:yes gene_type:complete
MQFLKITSTGKSNTLLGFLIKLLLIFIVIIGIIIMLAKIDFPSPNKEIETIIPNEELKIVK